MADPRPDAEKKIKPAWLIAKEKFDEKKKQQLWSINEFEEPEIKDCVIEKVITLNDDEEIILENCSDNNQTEQKINYSGYPTDMTRCSPFFPVNRNKVGDSIKEYLDRTLIRAANWGHLYYTGPKLTVFDEDVLVAILSLLYDKENHPLLQLVQDKQTQAKTLTYTGSALQLLKRMGVKRPNKNEYERLMGTIRRLHSASIEFQLSIGRDANSGKRLLKSYITNILIGVTEIDNYSSKNLKLTISPIFYKTFLDGAVTMLNTSTRLKLRSPLARVLYRFVMSQKSDVAYSGNFELLAESLNMDLKQPKKKNKQLLSKAIESLITHEILAANSQFIDATNVIIIKSPNREKTENKKSLAIDFSQDKAVQTDFSTSTTEKNLDSLLSMF